MADVEADFGDAYSLDTTQAGESARVYFAPDDALEERTFCRDHFRPIDLWWDGGSGLTVIHLDPPLLFVGYRRGTYTSPRKLIFRRAVYETIQPAEGTDPAGNVWRFQGRFNALCRGGELEIGPLVFGGQLLFSQDPITKPVLVRRGDCGTTSSEVSIHDAAYDPYADEPSQPDEGSCGGSGGGGDGDRDGTGDNGTGGDGDGPVGGEPVWGGGGRSMCPDDAPAYWDIDCIDLFIEGIGWVEYWCGAIMVCG